MKRRGILLGMLALVAIATVAVMGGPTPAAARPLVTKKVLGPVADAYTSKAAPDSNLGSGARLSIGGNLGLTNITWIRFEYPADFPTGATISKGTLRLFCVEADLPPGADREHQFNVGNPNRAWSELGIKQKNQPNLGGPRIQFKMKNCAENGEWIDIDITEFAVGWYDGSLNNYGIGLEPAVETTDKVFYFLSRDGSGPFPLGNAPELWLEYTGGVTPTVTPSNTPTPTETLPPSDTPVPTDTLTPTVTPTPSDTPTPTDTATITPTPTETPRPRAALLPILLRDWDMSQGVGAAAIAPLVDWPTARASAVWHSERLAVPR